MSDARAIGVFDSGFGGLTVLRELRRAMPAERMVYLGDVARLPYGPRSQDEVRLFAHEIARFLRARHDVKALVVACNTASAAAPELFAGAYNVPVIGVIKPGAHAAGSGEPQRAHRRLRHTGDRGQRGLYARCPRSGPRRDGPGSGVPALRAHGRGR